MAVGADIYLDLGLGRSYGKGVATGTSDLSISMVLRVEVGFHNEGDYSIKKPPRGQGHGWLEGVVMNDYKSSSWWGRDSISLSSLRTLLNRSVIAMVRNMTAKLRMMIVVVTAVTDMISPLFVVCRVYPIGA